MMREFVINYELDDAALAVLLKEFSAVVMHVVTEYTLVEGHVQSRPMYRYIARK